MTTPAEQIAEFVRSHPGEWRARFPGDVDGDMVLETVAGWLVLCPHGGRVSVTASKRGPDEADFCASDDERDAPILAQAAARTFEVCQAYNVPAEGLPPWLADPVRWRLRTRAGELLTLAGSSPADVVSAAETVDEALCKRAPAEPTLSAVLATLMEIGMSCQWIRNPGDTGISPEREALQDARTVLHGDDDAIMTREQLLDLVSNLRRILGVTLTPLEKYMRGPAPRCFNEGRDAMICARDEAQADGDHERVAWLQACLDGDWRDPAPQHRRVLETP